jgi:hypothetical protein
MSDDVMIAVDPHKAGNTAAVLDPVTKTLVETARFADSAGGYGRLTGFARRWEHRRRAVEGCRGAGRYLSRRLVADGELVLDVPAKLAARVRVYSRGHGRKTGRHDAVSIGLAALDGSGIAPAGPDDVLVSLRLPWPARGAVRAADPGSLPAAPAARRAHPGRHAPRADSGEGRGAAGPDPPRR